MSGPEKIYALDVRKNGFDDSVNNLKFNKENIRYVFTKEVNYDHACEATEKLLSENIAVTGFDDGIFSVASPVTITTIHQDIKGIAQTSIQTLISVINKETDISAVQSRIIPVFLVTRDSI